MPMKTSSGAAPLSRAKARNCVLINLLGAPGLGSLMAGRRVAGAGQLLLAIIGFVLVIGWFVLNARAAYDMWANDAEPKPVWWPGEIGGAIFLLSWVWALVTNMQILRSARKDGLPIDPPLLK
jgi:hypothetical protein